MDGILNILKPPGMTSFDVVAVVRGQLKGLKTGHAGTLDPIAAGVLPVCIGKSTKLLEYITGDDKRYTAEMTAGVETDTYDSTGTVTAETDSIPDPGEIRKIIKRFIGRIDQVPPMYSAIKIGGHKLYELARKGQTADIKPRKIEIYSIVIKDINGSKIIIDIHCSKGTYIRSLCHDVGEALGCGAHMSFLVRTSAGRFDIRDSLPINELESVISDGRLSGVFVPPRIALNGFSEAVMDDTSLKKLLNGQKVLAEECLGIIEGATRPEDREKKNLLAVYDKNDRIIAIAEYCSGGVKEYIKMISGKSLV